ncbi:helix-turn-helix transcriptional regulator [Acinetobacter qingfengensis]|uniref:Transcriptional regulator n=1 Tax=Acinetobacter qingfengensis TaxID=1262585 RepID=A0A1E7R1B3_9GAMM|nr:helix-turn-helix domain-containing protein [Acinetobacter qingfengensis]KAA8733270.1 helix-turn-helix transcriptional regulator [Acinetobacter qingfengensis]OEY93098.1 transcriptional regulator [Acinetobacter qingfengensis]
MSNKVTLSDQFPPEVCGIVKIAEILNDKWTILLLREAFYGTTKFNDFIKHTGISKQILSNRLKHLVQSNIFQLSIYKEHGTRERYEYLLTAKGKSLNIVLLAMLESGANFLLENQPAVQIFHQSQNTLLTLKIVDDKNHIVHLDDIELRITKPTDKL